MVISSKITLRKILHLIAGDFFLRSAFWTYNFALEFYRNLTTGYNVNMNSKRFLIRLVSLIIFIFLLNFLALKFYWYSSIWYFDMIMHFLGGLWLGLISIYLFSPTFRESFLESTFKVLLAVLFIGAGWEVFEILIDVFITKNSLNILDSTSDIFFDLAGGLSAIFYFLKCTTHVKENVI